MSRSIGGQGKRKGWPEQGGKEKGCVLIDLRKKKWYRMGEGRVKTKTTPKYGSADVVRDGRVCIEDGAEGDGRRATRRMHKLKHCSVRRLRTRKKAHQRRGGEKTQGRLRFAGEIQRGKGPRYST